MSDQQSQELAIVQPPPQPTADNIAKLSDIAIEAVKAQAEVAITVLKSAPSTQLVGNLSNRLDALIDRFDSLVAHIKRVEEERLLDNRNHDVRIGNLESVLSAAPPPLIVTDASAAKRAPSAALVIAEKALRTASTKNDGFHESIFAKRISRCTGELMRRKHVNVATLYNREIRKAIGADRPQKWDSIFEAIDDLGHAREFYDIVNRFYPDC